MKQSEESEPPPGRLSNSDSFCDLCQRTFCNKYYLTTHRHLKHGRMLSQGLAADLPLRGDLPQGINIQQLMLSLDPNHHRNLANLYMNQMGLNNGSPSPSSLPSSGSASTTGNNNENGSGAEPSSPKQEETPVPDLNGMNSILASLLPQMSQQNGLNPAGVNSFLEQIGMAQLNPLAVFQHNHLLSPLTPTKIAKMREAMDSPSKGSPQINFGSSFSFNLAPSTSTATSQPSVIVNSSDSRDDATPPLKRAKHEEDEEQPQRNPLEGLLFHSMNQSQCDECGKEFGNVFSLLQHKASEHADLIMNGARNGYECGECDKKFETVEYLEQHKITNHNDMQRLLAGFNMGPGFQFMLPGLPPQFDPAMAMAQMAQNKPAAVKRQYSSNGKNYCDLCNKEVCNKYFLRTHMLKMHGIVIDENKTVIANIDTLEREKTGVLSFRCDICSTELKSRSSLKQHKQENHGVVPISGGTPRRSVAPSAPSMVSANSASSSQEDSKCPICSQNVAKDKLVDHVTREHTDSSQLPNLFGNQRPETPQLECKFCCSQFAEEQSLQMHQIQHHPSEFMQMQINNTPKKLDPSVLCCNQCQYTTKEARNLEMHQERHERMNEAKTKGEDEQDEALQMTTEVALQMAVNNKLDTSSFKCSLCSICYADEQSLEAHINVSHPLNLTVPKKDTEEKIIERNSHTSGSISPSNESLPEAYCKPMNCEKPFVMQSFILKAHDEQGNMFSEIFAHLPVKSMIQKPTHITFELLPQ